MKKKFSIGDRVQLDFDGVGDGWGKDFVVHYRHSGVGTVLKTDDTVLPDMVLITVKFDNPDFTIDDWNDLCFCLEVIDDYWPSIPHFVIE